MLVGKPELKS